MYEYIFSILKISEKSKLIEIDNAMTFFIELIITEPTRIFPSESNTSKQAHKQRNVLVNAANRIVKVTVHHFGLTKNLAPNRIMCFGAATS